MSKFTDALKSAGNGLLTAAVVTADLKNLTHMSEIEAEIDRLQKEYAEFNERVSVDRRKPIPYVSK